MGEDGTPPDDDDAEDEKVGYGHPPKHSQFKKGRSGWIDFTNLTTLKRVHDRELKSTKEFTTTVKGLPAVEPLTLRALLPCQRRDQHKDDEIGKRMAGKHSTRLSAFLRSS